ncbi:MAG: hypothetical protein F4Y03_11315 [Alphaproteobacteria bacterium]|nr:hypothetical protein [Alphaproteobacteria bacterium]
MMKKAFLIGVALAVCLSAGGCVSNDLDGNTRNADGNEVWKCTGRFSSVDTIVLTRFMEGGLDIGRGTVRAAGVTHETAFRVDGIDRRWNWGLDAGSNPRAYRYSFLIEASGDGMFFNFGSRDRVKPSGFYECHTGILGQLLK